jgi:uncharacterized protein YegP (UPF0339 family)
MAGYYTLKQSDKNNQWYFNLKAGNHEVILQSEGYASKSGAENGIESVQENCTNDSRYDKRESTAGCWFVLKAANGQVIGKSEMYTTSGSRDNGIASVKVNGTSIDVRGDQ